jgi:hypothetical protein
VLYSALIAVAGFILGVRVGLAVGYRGERGRRIIQERKWLGELARALGARSPRTELESIDVVRARLLAEAARGSERRDRAESPAALPEETPPER